MMGKITRHPGRMFVLLVPIAAGLLAGCPQQAGPVRAGPGAATRPRGPNDPEPQPPDPPPTVQLIVSLRTMTVLVPAGRLEASEAFWPLLDEARLGLVRRELLEKNGFRVGVGRPELLDRIKEVLIAQKALRLSENNVAMITGEPVLIPTIQQAKGQAIFLTTEDGKLSGLNFPKSTNLFRVACQIRPPKLEDVVFDVVPEVRWGRRRRRVVPTPHGMRQLTGQHARLLMPVRFTLPVPKGHFFVIGPSERATVKLTAGHQFLRQKQDGKDYETVILLAFTVVRRQLDRRP